MKKLFLAILLLLGTLSVAANNIRYFTYTQVARTVNYLNNQNELMIYCGYADEIETYVLINEVWAEKVNSKFYEVWLFGYDAYTGEEIYMPIDLQCIWLPGTNNSYYNAAQYLRFRTTIQRPTLVWCMPPYNPYVRARHVPGHAYTYHWEIHRHDWRCPDWDRSHNTPPPYHPYYMRDPRIELQRPTQTWTPGVNRPTVPTQGYGVIHGTNTRQESSRNDGIRTPAGTISTNTNRNSGTTIRQGSTSTSSRGTTGTVNSGTSTRGTTTTGTTSRNNNNNGSSTRSTDTTTTTRSNTTTRNTSTGTSSRTENSGTSSRSTSSGTTTRTGTTSHNSNTGTTSRSNTKATPSTTQSSRSNNVSKSNGTVNRSSNTATGRNTTTNTTTRSTTGGNRNNR